MPQRGGPWRAKASVVSTSACAGGARRGDQAVRQSTASDVLLRRVIYGYLVAIAVAVSAGLGGLYLDVW
jgi:hypothetical protein